ncbi:hypothetical protein [Flavisolibacter ginsengisoli]|jgi:hypothetical protein|uniref:Uncharacterized protein n=1 Tax=Flavisolibacter ginsengisoli DSM 18119 TaxID=1121884 RepID=A0A1M5EQS8_9BACT|nr:hypothetical protein [Flavisolibacter ginsengisoli]SHF81638.1 hypothetical protein SAMN02745131_03606 [Flavisolibacter ginsengisoli DSM 18119]
MELDDLKQSWKETPIPTPVNKNIMEMIQHKSYGPVAALKRGFRKQMIIMALMPFILLLTNASDISKPLTSVLYWSYVAVAIGVIIVAYYNYRIADKMQDMNGMVKANLQQQVSVLQTRLRWKIIGLRIVFIFFIVLLEVLPYIQHYRMLEKWHSLPLFARFAVYLGFLLLQYFISPLIIQRKFGRHLNYLQSLVKEME